MKLYTVTYVAETDTMTHYIAAYVGAHSQEEAEREALEGCKRQYPTQEGYYSHRVSVGQIPDEAIRRAA